MNKGLNAALLQIKDLDIVLHYFIAYHVDSW